MPDPGQETVRWLKFELDVRLISLKVNNKPYQGASRVGQINESGIGLMIPANLKKNDSAVLEFTLPDSSDVFKVNAIMRNRTGFRYWFEFMDLSALQREKIHKAAASIKKSPESENKAPDAK